ncbi:MAG: hypothetical protein JW712_12685 [Dehalococcoidales bacterium]|nr:hypothetical protein [Dehalococcoidales bacterium]
MKTDFSEVQSAKMRLLDEPILVDIERIKFLQDIYTTTEGEPAILRRARVFEKTCDEKSIFIDENPIVGSVGKTNLAVYPLPEMSCTWMRSQLADGLNVGLGAVSSETMKQEELQSLETAIDYWETKCAFHRARKIYDETYRDEPSVIYQMFSGIVFSNIISVPMGFALLDYEKVLKKGLNGILQEIETEKAKLPVGLLDSRDKRYFYEAAIICLRALIRLSGRYAALARTMAENEPDPQRRKELIEIAETCEQVPANPARNFREACQSYYFTLLGALIESPNSAALAPGRFCLYMYPFYKQDKDRGLITEETAVTLLGWLFLKIQAISMFVDGLTFKANSGQIAMHISLGGLDADGEDATNDLDYLVLEAQKRLRLSQPSLTLLWHDKLPPELLQKSVELIRTGIGQPQFLNTELALDRLPLTFPGLTIEEARGAANVGCIPMRPSHSASNLWGGQINIGKIVELVLNNGRDRASRSQIGLKTGDAESFTTFDEFQEAVDRQIAHVVDRALNANNISFSILAEMLPLPYVSCFIDDCIKAGKDIQNGGARYSTNWCNPIGTVDLANSLAAIKKLVYDEQRFTIMELKQALRANFEGEEYRDIYALCCNAPKYGNDDDYVDSIAKHCYQVYAREHMKFKDVFGKVTYPEAFSVSLHNLTGSKTGALPSGRKANLPHTDASVSASPGTDTKGPTTLIRSAIKVLDNREYGSNHLNMKFHPAVLQGQRGTQNLLSLVKTYMKLGGNHIQFNCVNGETLKDAQLHPENYRDLVVRVAGFSAYFIHLDKGLQDEIIKRTELTF